MPSILNLFGRILAVVAIVATALPLLTFDVWWVRVLDFPRVQVAALAMLAMASLAPYVSDRLDGSLIALCAAAVLYQGWRIYPYTPIADREVEDTARDRTERISMLIANVLMENRSADALFDIVNRVDPDVVLMVEVDSWWVDHMRSRLADYPYRVERPLDNTYGIALYSRYELIDPQVQFLVEDDIPSVAATLSLASGRSVQVYGLHPRPPAPQESTDTTERDAEVLIVGKMAREHGGPTIVAGDLNDVAWSATTSLFREISGLLDPRIGRGLYNSFHAQVPLLRWPLDHVFHSSEFRLGRLEVLPAFGSDHFPIFIELSLDPDAKRTQEEPDAEPEDLTKAAQKIQEGLEEGRESKEDQH